MRVFMWLDVAGPVRVARGGGGKGCALLFLAGTPENLGIGFPLDSNYPDSILKHAWKEARIRAEVAVAGARKILNSAGLNIQDGKETPEGDARAIILDDAKTWGADLIMLGCHGKDCPDRLLMGSVSEAVALNAHCSVEVVRE